MTPSHSSGSLTSTYRSCKGCADWQSWKPGPRKQGQIDFLNINSYNTPLCTDLPIFLPTLPISTIWAHPTLSPWVSLKVQCHAWHKPTWAAPSSIPPDLHWCSLPWTLWVSYQLPAPKLQGCDSTGSCLAGSGRGFSYTALFSYFWKETPSHSLSPHLLLFPDPLPVSFFIIQRTSLLLKPEGGPEDPDPQPGAPFAHTPPAQEGTNARIKSTDTHTESGDQDELKISKQYLLQKFI